MMSSQFNLLGVVSLQRAVVAAAAAAAAAPNAQIEQLHSNYSYLVKMVDWLAHWSMVQEDPGSIPGRGTRLKNTNFFFD